MLYLFLTHAPIVIQRFPVENRPEEYGRWQQYARFLHKVVDLRPGFVDRFKTWYWSIQPEWRRGDELVWPFHQNLPAAVNDWSSLRQGGKSGIFLIIVGLAMAELGSAAPTAGGLYYWTFKYASSKYRKVLSWLIGCRKNFQTLPSSDVNSSR